jgi:hypothetical protein
MCLRFASACRVGRAEGMWVGPGRATAATAWSLAAPEPMGWPRWMRETWVGDGDGRGGCGKSAEGAVARGQPQPAPRLLQRRRHLLRRARPPPSRVRVHRRVAGARPSAGAVAGARPSRVPSRVPRSISVILK